MRSLTAHEWGTSDAGSAREAAAMDIPHPTHRTERDEWATPTRSASNLTEQPTSRSFACSEGDGHYAAHSCGADSAAGRPHRLPISRDDHDPERAQFQPGRRSTGDGSYRSAAGRSGGEAGTTELPLIIAA
jgi:hypothetical protein